MKLLKTFAIFSFIFALVSSCAPVITNLTELNLGMTKQEVIKKLGEPNLIAFAKKYENGTLEILEYQKVRQDSSRLRFNWLHFWNNELTEWGPSELYTKEKLEKSYKDRQHK